MRIYATLTALFIFLSSAVSSAYTVISAENPSMMGWDTKVLTIALNDSNCPRRFDMSKIVVEAMKPWNEALAGKIELRLGGASGTNADTAVSSGAPDSPVIVCDPDFIAHTRSNGDSTPGQSGVLLDTGSNHLVYGYMLLNVQDGALAHINNIPLNKVIAIVGHELGHIIGLGHSDDQMALMYYDVSNKRGPTLNADDVQGAVYLYTEKATEDDSPLGCGTLETIPPANRPGPQTMLPIILLVGFGYRMLRRRNIKGLQ